MDPNQARLEPQREAALTKIITQARMAPARAKGALVLSGLTALLMWGSFTPLDFGPLGWICLVPICLLVRLERRTAAMYRALYLGGFVFWMLTLQWMRLGHATMYGAWLLTAIYMAFYFPAFVAIARVAVWRLGAPVMVAVPVAWTGLELLRAYLLTGAPWYFLAHSQHRWTDLIQVSDLVGAYGVSFLLALFAGCVAELAPASWIARLRLLPEGGLGGVRSVNGPGRAWRLSATLLCFALVLGYGYARRAGVVFEPGPRVALIQGNFDSDVKHDPARYVEMQRRHEELTGMAVLEQPDLIVWPETMFRWPLFNAPAEISTAELEAAHPGLPVARLRDPNVTRRLANLSQMARAGLVVGLEAIDADLQSIRRHNSAVMIDASGVITSRYDKLHRVVFGEYVPLAETFPWIRKLTPFPEGFGIEAGTQPVAMQAGAFRFSPIICFEDTVPHLVQRVIRGASQQGPGGKHIDFLVNLTNDGWFHGSSELDQHLITASFRCVENRIPMVRAVNTGISAFIDGDGLIRKRAVGMKTGKPKSDEAVVVDEVPLDSRRSLYLQAGDWFAGACLAACGFTAIMGLLSRFVPALRLAR
jgi:apolipoprotein N-acyltransferase